MIKVIENPLAKAEPLVLKRGDIVERQKVDQLSIMPKGLLDKLTREEILDLIAYVSSRGKREHEVFRGEGRTSTAAAPHRAGTRAPRIRVTRTTNSRRKGEPGSALAPPSRGRSRATDALTLR